VNNDGEMMIVVVISSAISHLILTEKLDKTRADKRCDKLSQFFVDKLKNLQYNAPTLKEGLSEKIVRGGKAAKVFGNNNKNTAIN
jgi:hypothetical protein